MAHNRKLVRGVAALVIALGFGRGSVAGQDLVLTNARIVDPATRTIVRGSLWIQGGWIAGRGEHVPAGAPGERIDVNGRWIIPGLNDLHTHSFGNAAPGRITDGSGTQSTAMRVLRAGVTSFLDLFSAEDYILGVRDRQRAGELEGAEIFAAGPCFTATNGHCSEYGIPTRLIDTPEEARQQLRELVQKEPDVVKVVYDHFDYGPTKMPTVDRATLEALIAEAEELDLKTVVHVGTWEDVRHAVLAGASAVTHVPRDGPAPEDIVSLMAERQVYHIPTLVVHTELGAMMDHPELADVPLLAALTTQDVRDVYRSAEAWDERTRTWAARQRDAKPDVMESVGRLHGAGVPMLTGTDAGNWGVIQGYSVHRELVRLVEAGLTPWDALAASTINAGQFLGRKFGVHQGDEANLVVLDGSPIEEITNTQRISMVVMRGEIVYQR